MEGKRDSFVFYRSFFEAIGLQKKNVQAEIYNAIADYALNGTEPNLPPEAMGIFLLIRPRTDRGIKLLTGQNARHCGEYAKWRREVFKRDNYTCQRCGKRGCVLNAHHIKKFSLYPALRFEIRNGVTLCEKCHREVHKNDG